jgi:hypothetical protein
MMVKALWMKEKVRQASEAEVVVRFSAPARLALGGLINTPHERKYRRMLEDIYREDGYSLRMSFILFST